VAAACSIVADHGIEGSDHLSHNGDDNDFGFSCWSRREDAAVCKDALSNGGGFLVGPDLDPKSGFSVTPIPPFLFGRLRLWSDTPL
jgi:hypothetical protein